MMVIKTGYFLRLMLLIHTKKTLAMEALDQRYNSNKIEIVINVIFNGDQAYIEVGAIPNMYISSWGSGALSITKVVHLAFDFCLILRQII